MTLSNKCVYIYIIFILMCPLYLPSSSATLTTTNSIIKIEASPGEHFSQNLTVSLSSDEKSPINIIVKIQDWCQNLNGANAAIKNNPDIEPYSAKKFLSVSPKTFTIKPGEAQQVKIEGDMPAGNGGRYAIVSVDTLPKPKPGGIGLSFEMNALVLLTIKGSNLSKTGEIENLTLMESVLPRQQNVTMLFKNTGNCLYSLDATISAKDKEGNILAVTMPRILGGIIPTAIRQIKASLTPESWLKPGNYTVSAEVALKDGTVLATKEIKFEIK
jgi:P pilus assembly chaperone PapD